MLLAAELERHGFYWYHEWIGGLPVLVEVRRRAGPWTVHFCRRHDDRGLAELRGLFQCTVAANDAGHGESN